MIQVKQVNDSNQKEYITNYVLRSLPHWFGIESSLVDYVNKSKDQYMLAAFEGDEVVGFLTLVKTSDYAYEVHVMGVLPEHHRKGIGQALIKESVNVIREENMMFLTVKTLSADHPDEGYAKTREFYRSVGFIELEVLPELWGVDNPCLNMIMIV